MSDIFYPCEELFDCDEFCDFRYLKNNSLTEIKMSDFEGLDQLSWLFLDHNEISKFRIPSLPNLKWLDLTNNTLKLEKDDDAFPHLPNILEMLIFFFIIFFPTISELPLFILFQDNLE